MQQKLWDGLNAVGWKDKYRDCLIANSLDKEIRSPLLDMDVIRTVMRVHPRYKINKERDKLLLRKIAQGLGLPAFICNRPKKATQYGSGVDKALRKLAKTDNKRLEDYLESFL